MRTVRLNILLLIVFLVPSTGVFGSDTDELLNLLNKKSVITQEEASSLRADLAIQKQEEESSKKEFAVSGIRPLKLAGYAQVRYIAKEDGIDGFDIRRARLDFKGNFTERFEYRTQVEFGSTAIKLLDASISYKFDESRKITFGQFIVPFSLENLTSNTKIETVNRSQVVEALAGRSKDVIGDQNGDDIGVQMSGSLFPQGEYNFIEYTAGVFNGSGINKADLNEQKDVAARIVLRPFKELSIGGSIYDGLGNYGTPANDKNRDRVEADIAYFDGVLSVRAEAIVGKDDTVEKDGWYAQAGYFLFPKELELVAKYDLYDPNTSKANDETGVATFGVNWFFNKLVFVQVNYEYKVETGTALLNNGVAAQLTLQF